MAKNLGPRLVQCYHCGHRFEVGGRAQSTSCPGCNKAVMVADQDIKGRRGPIRELRTCGKITIGRRGRLICEKIEAHAGIQCTGIIDSKEVVCGSKFYLGPKATMKGDLSAPAAEVKEGAKVLGGYWQVPHDPQNVADLPQRE